MTDFTEIFTKGWTPGGIGIWGILVVVLGLWWKGLPAVLDAWSHSVDRERAHREREIERLEGQIRASDDRHEECMKGQAILRDEINRLNKIITGMVLQMRQIQISATNIGSGIGDLPPEMAALVIAMGKLPSV